MSWVRFDDGYRDHPKMVFAGKDGRELHTAMIFYCAHNLTDGIIHQNMIAKLALMEEIPDWEDAVDRMLTIIPGFDQPSLHALANGFFEIHDYLQYQPSRAKVIKERTEAKERMQRARTANSEGCSDNVRPEHVTNIERSSAAPESRIPNPESGSESESESGKENTQLVLGNDLPVGNGPQCTNIGTVMGSETGNPAAQSKSAKRRNPQTAWDPDGFEQCWVEYPRGEGKPEARKEWDKQRPDSAVILASIRKWNQSDAWQKGIGIPYFVRFLSKGRSVETPYAPPVATQEQSKGDLIDQAQYYAEKIAKQREAMGVMVQ